MLRAFLHTSAAVYAKMSFESYFRFLFPRFDVLAPDTAQRTTFEKNQASYTGTVMQTKMLY
jgi:hypothetical protein